MTALQSIAVIATAVGLLARPGHAEMIAMQIDASNNGCIGGIQCYKVAGSTPTLDSCVAVAAGLQDRQYTSGAGGVTCDTVPGQPCGNNLGATCSVSLDFSHAGSPDWAWQGRNLADLMQTMSAQCFGAGVNNVAQCNMQVGGHDVGLYVTANDVTLDTSKVVRSRRLR